MDREERNVGSTPALGDRDAASRSAYLSEVREAFATSDASSTARPHAESIDEASVFADSSLCEGGQAPQGTGEVARKALPPTSSRSAVFAGSASSSASVGDWTAVSDPPVEDGAVRASASGAAGASPGASAAFAFWIAITCPRCGDIITADFRTALEAAIEVIPELVDHEYDCPLR